jgi:hypothetical protein
VGSYEHGNEPWDSIIDEGFLDLLSNYQLFKDSGHGITGVVGCGGCVVLAWASYFLLSILVCNLSPNYFRNDVWAENCTWSDVSCLSYGTARVCFNIDTMYNILIIQLWKDHRIFHTLYL